MKTTQETLVIPLRDSGISTAGKRRWHGNSHDSLTGLRHLHCRKTPEAWKLHDSPPGLRHLHCRKTPVAWKLH